MILIPLLVVCRHTHANVGMVPTVILSLKNHLMGYGFSRVCRFASFLVPQFAPTHKYKISIVT